MEDFRFAAYGLGLGLAVALGTWVLAWWKQRGLRKEVTQLRRHLHTQMEITQEGSDGRKHELAELRKQNENLRLSVKGWQQKPGRAEIRMLHVYDRAVHKLLETAPGFSMAWEGALKEAEQQVEQVDGGLLAFAKRLVLPGPKPED